MSVQPTILRNDSNMISVRNGCGQILHFSYKTLVCLEEPTGTRFRTSKFWSRTTSKHIGKFGCAGGEAVEQNVLEGMVK